MVFLGHLPWHMKTNSISHNKSLHPQIRGLDSSAMTIKYSISSIEEEAEYLRHAILGTRLLECSQRWSKNWNSLT